MPRKKLPAHLKLDVPLIRAITAIRVQLDNQLENNPNMRSELIALDDALEKAENDFYEHRPADYSIIRVKYHETDFILI